MDDFLQLTVNGLIRGSFYAAIGAGLALVIGVTGRFHFSYSLTYTVAPYAAFLVASATGLGFWPAAAVGVLAAIIVNVLTELLIYRPVAARAGANSLLAVMVSSIGFSIFGVALIQLTSGSGSVAFYGPALAAIDIGPVRFTNFDLMQVLSSLGLVSALALVLAATPLGRSIRATRSNPALASVLGIDSGRINLIVFAFSGLIAGVCAIWYGLQYTVEPGMGDRIGMYGFVVAFLAGLTRSPARAILVGLALGLLEQWASIVLSVQWSQTSVFVVLVIYLIVLSAQRGWRPRPLRRRVSA